ncbi:MFS transporter [Rhodococcus opacus]|uniref:Putative aromatic acid transporter n=1 Tax=Rhodococcus opacus (strain B4) TaxID=632772 RepID=C1BAR4_RHOOB|nr:MFS transporter [Rhodococcus opacus]BAH52767.1 putative aromatic acid transporter [Rhodococcus opacus B4]
MTFHLAGSATNGRSSTLAVVATCLAITTLDGLDLIMFGTVLPTLLEKEEWGITAASAGLVGSLSLVGMLIGAMFAGYFTDIVGRRPVILACVVNFSLFTALCAFAPNLELFGLFRFAAGIGFGGALPTVIALTMEYVPFERRQFFNGVIQTGFTIGGCVAAISAIYVIPAYGWHMMFLVGGALGVVVLAITLKTLPESVAFLIQKGRHDEAQAIMVRYSIDMRTESGRAVTEDGSDTGRGRALARLFAPGYRGATVLFPLISFCGLLVAYAMNTWIPQMLRSTGYDLGSALVFLLAFNLGSAMGMVVLSGLADRFGPRPVISTGFVVGAIAVSVLTLEPAQALVFALILLIGFCSASQTAVSGFVGIYYSPRARGTALGLAIGLGRLGGVCGPIVAGLIVGSSLGTQWAFYVFAAVGLVAAALVVAVPKRQPDTVAVPAARPAAAHRADMSATQSDS